jgi:multimeric flavodoxin WrbA
MMTRILAINGSYRDDGVTDQDVYAMIQAVKNAGAEVEMIQLRDYPIEFCLNCRECTQQAGENPGRCVQHDDMHKLIDKIEQADAYILASPTNFGAVTAIFKRFMERLIVYAYWPWNTDSPKFRKAHMPRKKAVLVSSCAAPGFFGRILYGTYKQLKQTATTIGADTVGTIFTGLIAKDPRPRLSEKVIHKAQAEAVKLVKV